MEGSNVVCFPKLLYTALVVFRASGRYFESTTKMVPVLVYRAFVDLEIYKHGAVEIHNFQGLSTRKSKLLSNAKTLDRSVSAAGFGSQEDRLTNSNQKQAANKETQIVVSRGPLDGLTMSVSYTRVDLV